MPSTPAGPLDRAATDVSILDNKLKKMQLSSKVDHINTLPDEMLDAVFESDPEVTYASQWFQGFKRPIYTRVCRRWNGLMKRISYCYIEKEGQAMRLLEKLRMDPEFAMLVRTLDIDHFYTKGERSAAEIMNEIFLELPNLTRLRIGMNMSEGGHPGQMTKYSDAYLNYCLSALSQGLRSLTKLEHFEIDDRNEQFQVGYDW
jgi:hypothetical protein